MKRKVVQIVFVILIIAIAYFRISNDRNKPIKETRVALGTFVTIDIQDRNVNNKEIIDSSFALIHKYEDKLSILIENSEVSKINSSEKNEIQISNDVKNLIDESHKISELSNGAFDITIGTILEKYNFVNKIMPDSNEIKNMLNLVDYKYLQTKGNKLIKKKKNIHIDLGGIAKGYIVDKVIEYLTLQGIQYAAVNAGGDLFVLGNKKNDVWKIGIRHPRSEDEIFGEVSLKNMSIVTSGDYEQFFFIDGKRIHHILDPKTG
ncbi:MAG: FAD:protein FMN transferase, partial [Candidatus Cloacimonetes bacterium]|nr:FAD:protein FMN transferase [Candidatus Cloacimonadota bacterium]